MALENLKKYFRTKNLIDCVRNELAAAEEFFKEIMVVSGKLVDFCDGCLHYMIEQYISYGGSEEFEVPDPPNCNDLRLSFFCK